ncbi:CRAL TRIO domain-containing protein [Boletus reticuloceps]|uniref:CRAL TRIO domain-containing protein n=1 Tax=Boletus reticuloceps TaxID=495285 RepID=A0A8I3A6M5_9AGAM|nr:CRAL TRIO domain-containing protein [Boletus reticuloceps]
MEEERMWLSYECILRYIRATKHDVSESIKRLEDTLQWRRDFGLYTLVTAEHVEPEAVTGKEFLFGYDTRGRPALYMCPSRQNTEESPRQIHFVFWIMERAIELMGPGVETIVLMIDYADKAKNPSFSTARQVLHILQTHYPERLGAAIIAHLPWLLGAFYKLINPFIDPVTRAKMVFNPVPDDRGLWRSAEARDQGQDDAKLFEPDQLVSESWLGAAPFTYAHEPYWPALLSMSETRRNDMTRVWRELGGVVGIKEWDVKVGVRDGLADPATDVAGQAL